MVSAYLTDRRLALCPVPVAGESLLSWLDRVADCFEVTRDAAAIATGLLEPAAFRQHWGTVPALLPKHVIARMSARTGLPPHTIGDMTVAAYPLLRQHCDAAGRPPWWFDATSSGSCPECMRESDDIWLTDWRLAFVAGCSRHRCYLVHRCECGRALHGHLGGRVARSRCTGALKGSTDGSTCGRWMRDLPCIQMRDLELLNAAEPISAMLHGTPVDTGRGRSEDPFEEFEMVVELVRNFGTIRMMEGCGDSYIVDAFSAYCAARDSRDRARYRKFSKPAVMAAAVRIAAGLVFADDIEERAWWFSRRVDNPHWYTSIRLFADFGGSALAQTLVYACEQRRWWGR